MKDPSRTEKPTPKRREKARSEGNVAKSMELNSAVVLTAASLMLIWFGHDLFDGLALLTKSLLGQIGTMEVSIDSIPVLVISGFQKLLLLLAPLYIGVMVAGVAVNVGQVGFRVTPKAAYPKLSRMSPLQGLSRLFSPRSLVDLAKSILKLLVVGGVVYISISSKLPELQSLSGLPMEDLVAWVGALLGRVFLTVSLSLLVIGALDYVYAKYEYEQSLKMTKEEVKEESRQSEGDPKVKSKIREIQFKTAYRRMMKKVPEADVVITNPTTWPLL